MTLAVLLIAAGLLILFAYGVAALRVADAFTRSKRQRVRGTPAGMGLRYEEAQFRAADEMVLRGWFLESPGARAAVLLIHDVWGTRSDREQGLLGLARDYVSHGYHVFTFDLRGRGESSGARDYLGSQELRDARAAARYVRGRAGRLPLIVHGFGLGGALAISIVAEGVEADAVIADSPFASARDYMRHRWQHVPAHQFRAACWLARHIYRADVDALAPVEVIASVAPTPVLLIHGEADVEVPPAHTCNLAAATINERNELWMLPGVGHCGAYVADPAAYFRRCRGFIEEAVPARLLVATAG